MPDPLRIGLASCLFHADLPRPIFKGKTLLYLEDRCRGGRAGSSRRTV